jgi:hypothetical protein
MIKEELAEQLRITKQSEFALKKSLEKLSADFFEKEKILKGYDEKFQLAQESLKLFYATVKYKEEEINLERL